MTVFHGEILRSSATRVHPLLSGWLDKLERYRTDLAGLQLDAYRAEMFAFLRRHDVILYPAYAQSAIPHCASIRDGNFRGFSHIMAYNVAGWPAAVVRGGWSPAGLPVGVQIVARPWREDVALAVARRLEEALGGYERPSL